MNKGFYLFFKLLFLLSISFDYSIKAEHIHGLQCGHAASIWSSIDSPSQRYAPDRAVDIQHFDLDVTPDFKNRRVSGTATFTFQPILKPLGQLRLDAHDLEIHTVTGSTEIESMVSFIKTVILGG